MANQPRIEFLKQSNGIHVVLFSGHRGEFKLLDVAKSQAKAEEIAAQHRAQVQQ